MKELRGLIPLVIAVGLIASVILYVEDPLREVQEVEVSNTGPRLVGITEWINSPPLSLGQLKGKVVLVDLWTYS